MVPEVPGGHSSGNIEQGLRSQWYKDFAEDENVTSKAAEVPSCHSHSVRASTSSCHEVCSGYDTYSAAISALEKGQLAGKALELLKEMQQKGAGAPQGDAAE